MRNKFGARNMRCTLIENFNERSATVEVVVSANAMADPIGDNSDVGLGLTSPSPSSPAGVTKGSERHNMKFLQPAELEESRRKMQEKLQRLSSTPATERKRELLADSADAAVRPIDATVFTIVSLDVVNTMLVRANCKICSGDLNMVREKHDYKLSVKLVMKCMNYGVVSSKWSLPHVRSAQQVNPFAVNVLATRAMQATGNRQTALNDLFSLINISCRGLHTKTWQSYVKLAPVADCAARNLTSECARSVRKLYSELCLSNPGNIAVSYNGSWTTRGHSSLIGVGTVIELFTGFVID